MSEVLGDPCPGCGERAPLGVYITHKVGCRYRFPNLRLMAQSRTFYSIESAQEEIMQILAEHDQRGTDDSNRA